MQHFFTIPINDAGLINDAQSIETVQRALQRPFGFTDFYLYSHGWWTTANRALVDYNRFSIGFAGVIQSLSAKVAAKDPAPARDALAIGIHWPSMLSEDQDALKNWFQAMSYYSMEHRADQVGTNGLYALLRMIAETKPVQSRINLIGHSFGCKVACAALQELWRDTERNPLPADMQINVILLQAAFDDDDLAPGEAYGKVLTGFPNARFLISTSDWDLALKDQYPRAQKVNIFASKGNKNALGWRGPAPAVRQQLGAGEIAEFDVVPGSTGRGAGAAKTRVSVANLTPVHAAHRERDPESFAEKSGNHSDIFCDELYALMVEFLAP